MTRLRAAVDHAIAAVIIALFDVLAWALNHTPKEPW